MIKRRKYRGSKANTSFTATMPPKNDDKDIEDEDIGINVSFKDLEKLITRFIGDDTDPIEISSTSLKILLSFRSGLKSRS